MQEVAQAPIRRGGVGYTHRKVYVDDLECPPRGHAADLRRAALLGEFYSQPLLWKVQGGGFDRLSMKWEAGKWMLSIERDE